MDDEWNYIDDCDPPNPPENIDITLLFNEYQLSNARWKKYKGSIKRSNWTGRFVDPSGTLLHNRYDAIAWKITNSP